MSVKNESKSWAENEAPIVRWIAAFVVSLILGAILGSFFSLIMSFLPFFDDGMYLEPFGEFFVTIFGFAGFFIGCILSLKWICRTSLRSFLFGRGRKPDIKNALIAGALMAAGMIACSVPHIKNITIEEHDIGIVLLNLLFCLMFVWIQTTTEEIFFRGFFLRVPYKNEIPRLPRGLLFAFISSLFFMAAHLYNPEVTTLSFGADLILGAASYFIGAFIMYISNLLIGGMEAGLVFHFLNNFFCFFLIREKVSALVTPTIFVDNTATSTGTNSFFSELIVYAPAMIYLIWVYRRRNKKS